MEKKVNYIPAARPLQHKKVGIYCRVSTNDIEQLNSLTNQISALTRLVSSVDEWKLVDCYIDIASAKGKSPRSNFERMLDDCKSKKLDIVITKSVSRVGRDTVDTLQALNVMKEFGVRVIFEQESLDTKDVESSLMISIIESLAQAENESRSDNIKWGNVVKIDSDEVMHKVSKAMGTRTTFAQMNEAVYDSICRDISNHTAE